jgi:hypothetical protein
VKFKERTILPFKSKISISAGEFVSTSKAFPLRERTEKCIGLAGDAPLSMGVELRLDEEEEEDNDEDDDEDWDDDEDDEDDGATELELGVTSPTTATLRVGGGKFISLAI